MCRGRSLVLLSAALSAELARLLRSEWDQPSGNSYWLLFEFLTICLPSGEDFPIWGRTDIDLRSSLQITFSIDRDILVELLDFDGGDTGGLTGGRGGLEGLRFLRGVELGGFSREIFGNSTTFSSFTFGVSFSECWIRFGWNGSSAGRDVVICSALVFSVFFQDSSKIQNVTEVCSCS